MHNKKIKPRFLLKLLIVDSIIETCNKETLLCIACDITLKNEFITTKTIAEWSKNLPEIHKRPTVFLLY
jgi:16S rRNA (cytidine1402-2'-O)-methyltransferase